MLRAELKVIGGKQHGSLIPLQTKKFLVGREQDCQLRPTSESVSRHHCVFSIDDYGIRLRDLGSTNGTFVNGQRVQGQVVLQPNDRVLIGKLEFEIVIEGLAQAVHHSRVASVSSTESALRSPIRSPLLCHSSLRQHQNSQSCFPKRHKRKFLPY